jgi:hypothetical protein
MYKKKLMILSLATLIPLSLPLWAEQEAEHEATDAAASMQTEATASPAEAPDTATAPEAAADNSSDASSGGDMSDKGQAAPPGYARALDRMQAHMQQRNQAYEDLKKRAQSMGVILPEKPPWSTPGGMESMMQSRMQPPPEYKPMSQEEMELLRKKHYEEMDALRKQRYEEMRERAKAAGIDMPETPPWEQAQSNSDDEQAKQKAIINGMSEEQRAACQAMHRRQMGMWDAPQRPMMPAPGMGRGMGPGMMNRGYGYGPYGYGPDSYGYGPDPYAGQQNFWNPGNP